MKKNVLLLLIIFLSAHLNGQISKGNVILSVDGAFRQSYLGSGVSTNQFGGRGKYLEASSSVEYFFSDRLSMGVGLDYHWSKETKTNSMFLKFPDINFIHIQQTDTKTQALLPTVFIKHYIPLVRKLYFNTNLQASFGKIKSEYSTIILDFNRTNKDYGTVEDNPEFVNGSADDAQVDYFAVQLGPELSYFINSSMGVCLSMGGVEYGMYDWKGDNSVWQVSFNPAYWNLGFKIKL